MLPSEINNTDTQALLLIKHPVYKNNKSNEYSRSERGKRMNQGTVLVVEDDPALREVICETLQLAKYHVETAENGQQALQLLDSQQGHCTAAQ